MKEYSEFLNWLEGEQAQMEELVERWSNINSHTDNQAGLKLMLDELRKEFAVLGGVESLIPTETYSVLNEKGEAEEVKTTPVYSLRKRPEAKLSILLCIHYDTVFPVDSSFQNVERSGDGKMVGPGVVDAKSGIIIILKALQALEKSPFAENLGWEVLLNPDEEIGSPASHRILGERALDHSLGLLFEPAMPGGEVAANRKGAGNFTAVVHGKAAHVGREFDLGRNAVHLIAEIISKLSAMNSHPDLIVNFGRTEGGGPANVVSDFALSRFNVRASDAAAQEYFLQELETLRQELSKRDGFQLVIDGGFGAPPKKFAGKIEELYGELKSCAEQLGQSLEKKDTGGVCDGNRLAAAGLPNIDTLGGRGGGAHSHQEFLELKSLRERACLTALFLMKVGAGEIKWET